MVLLQQTHPGVNFFSIPHDSTLGVPPWAMYITLAFFVYVVVYFYLSLRRDKLAEKKREESFVHPKILLADVHFTDQTDNGKIQVCVWEKDSEKLLFVVGSQDFNRVEGWLNLDNVLTPTLNYNYDVGLAATKRFFALCKKQGIKKIKAKVEKEDWWNIHLIKKFYRRLGFYLEPNTSKKTAYIERGI